MATAGDLFGASPTVTPTTSTTTTTTTPKKTVAVGELFGTAEATPVEEPQMSRAEELAWMAAGVGVPMVAGIGGSLVGTPLVGAGAAGLGSSAVEAARQLREKQLGIRKEVSPGLIAFEGVTGSIPGVPLEKLGVKTLGKKIVGRAVEGAGMGGVSATGRAGIGEGRLPTAGELFSGVTVGGVAGGTVGGGAEYLGSRFGPRPAMTAAEAETLPSVRTARELGADVQIGETPVPPEALAQPMPTRSPESQAQFEAAEQFRQQIQGAYAPYAKAREDWITEGQFRGEPPPSVADSITPEQIAYAKQLEQDYATLESTPLAQAPPPELPPVEPVQMVPKPGETIGGQPPPPPGGEAPPPGGRPLPPEQQLGAEPTTAEAAASRAWAASPFRKVPGLATALAEHEAKAAGIEVPPPPRARPRPGERLQGELEGVRRMWGGNGGLNEPELQAIEWSIRNSAEDIAHVTRGEMPVELTQRLAKDLNFNVERAGMQPKGSIWNAEQIEAAGMHIDALGRRIERFRAAYEADPLDGRTGVQLQDAFDELTTTILAYQGRKAEVGRALNIMKTRKQAFDTGDPRFIAQAARLGASPDEIVDVLKTVAPDDAAGRYRALMKMRNPGFLRHLQTYYMMNILSAPMTHERNVLGNLLNLAKTPVTMATAGRLTGHGRGEAGAYMRGAFGLESSLRPAWKGMMHIMREGFTEGDIEKFELPPVELFPSIGGKAGAGLNVVSRGMRAMDFAFRTMAAQGELRSMAHAQAQRELGTHADTDALATRMAQLIDDPTPAMLDHVERASTRTVFQSTHWLDSKLLEIKERYPLFGFVVPFIRTPMNIMRQGAQFSPLGFASKTARGGDRLAQQAQAEAALGSMLLAPIAWLAYTGNITGAGPSNPDQKDMLYGQGWQPNSLKIGGRYYNYSVLGPLAFPLSVVANGFDKYREITKQGQELDADFPLRIAQGLGKTLLDQSYLKGLSDLLEAFEDDSGYRIQSFLSRIAGGFIPAGSAVRSTAQAIDPVLRAPESVAEGIQAQIPFASRSLNPRIRASGEPIERPDVFGGNPVAEGLGRMFNPVMMSPERPDPVRKEMQELGMTLAVPRDEKLDGERLPSDASLALRQAKGFAQHAAVGQLLARPDWAERDETTRRAQIALEKTRVGSYIMERAKALKKWGEPITIEALWPPSLGAPPFP